MQLLEIASDMNSSGAVIFVAVKLNAECREMLTWIVAKLAQAGDKIVAVHVVRSGSKEFVLDPSTKHRLDDTFESVLSVYQSICNLKQVRLDIKVVSGTSLRKSLVDAANMEKASKLVLAGSKHACESLAKYCLKSLPSSSYLLIVEQGQIVYCKEGLQPSCENKKAVSQRRPASVTPAQRNAASDHMRVYGQSKSDRSLDCRIKPLQQANPGWPLMHRSISLDKAATGGRGLSVVKWALQLPDRLKVVFDKQGSNVMRTLASSAMADQSVPRLKSGTPKAAEESRPDPECTPEHATAVSSTPGVLTSRAAQVSFFQKMAHLCRNTPCVRFTYSELQEATSNFSERNVVGKGGCSKVYRGELSDGRLVAVKCLKEGAAEADDELLTEVEILASIKHPRIITLLGYYVDTQTHILVYNFASGGNLEENLHSATKKCWLNWEARLKIAIGAAEALAFLHDGCARPVIHRDVKSSNILVSSSFGPQLSDFGLAKWAPTSTTHITCSDVVGTLGYLAPEYFMFGRVNDKTDVFAFGVVLLELITGRPPIDMSRPKGEENLAAWARTYLDSGRKDQLLDPRLQGRYDENQLNNMIAAASSCIRQSSQYRPRMTRVLRMLSGEDSTCPSGRYDLTDDYEFPVEPETNDVRKHLALAMMGVDDDVASQSSAEQNSIDLVQSNKSLDDYMGDRYRRSNSFD